MAITISFCSRQPSCLILPPSFLTEGKLLLKCQAIFCLCQTERYYFQDEVLSKKLSGFVFVFLSQPLSEMFSCLSTQEILLMPEKILLFQTKYNCSTCHVTQFGRRARSLKYLGCVVFHFDSKDTVFLSRLNPMHFFL